MKRYYKLLIITCALFMTACIKEGYDSENCPDDHKVTVVWPSAPTDGNVKDVVITVINPDGSVETITAGSNTILEDGKNLLIGSSAGEKDEVTIVGEKVTVNTNPDGTCCEPGGFKGGSLEIEIGPNMENITDIEVPVTWQTRPLEVHVKFVGYAAQAISDVNGTVEGIAISRLLNNGFPPLDGTKRPTAIKEGSMNYHLEQSGANDFFQCSKRLLGIQGTTKQNLSLQVTFSDGTVADYPFDITTDMDNFHTENVEDPWIIEITLRIGADFSATIEDWR